LAEGSAQAVAAGVAGALAAAGVVVVLLGSVLSIWAARRSLAPLTHMAANAAAISLASPGKRMAYDGPPDELGMLAHALNAMLERLEHAYAEQRRFVADASHELRTPVAIVRGNVELLRTGKLGGADALEGLEMIDSESKRMSRLLDELLALARLESSMHTFQPLEVRTILEEGAGRARLLGDRRVTIEGPCHVWTEGDPDLLDQALLNVLKNAVAHTTDGGMIELSCDADDTHVRLTITDDGPGIPEEELARIFDRFYRGQGPRPGDSGGAGLGLAIAQRLVDLHGGSMSAENVEGAGARFTIILPRIVAPEDLLAAP
jgi:signal transduction histidine kinase